MSAGGCGRRATTAAPAWPDLVLTPEDRILVLAPHPDDEALACGGVLQRAVDMRLPVRVVFFTYGDNNQWSFLLYRKHPVVLPPSVRRMGLVRHDEAEVAARSLGVPGTALIFLGYPDFGTLQIWKAHWGDRPPFRSMLTHVTAVPYPNALRPGAPYTGDDILADLKTVLRDFRPTKIFVSHPGDHMPDHAALYLFTRVALWELESEMRPALYPYLVHVARWPYPRGERSHEPLQPPHFFAEHIAWQTNRLTPTQVERKRAAIKAHRSQYAYSASYLMSFVRPNELFGDFPTITLSATTPAFPLAEHGSGESREAAEQLTEEERAAFVGLEEQSVTLENGALVLSVTFSRPLAPAVKASVFAFGYRADRPFAQMPKLHLVFGALRHACYDQDRRLPPGVVDVVRGPRTLTIRIPLTALGMPEKILTSASTYLGEVPLDWASWRTLEIASAVDATETTAKSGQ